MQTRIFAEDQRECPSSQRFFLILCCNLIDADRLDAIGEYELAVEDYTRALNLEGSIDL